MSCNAPPSRDRCVSSDVKAWHEVQRVGGMRLAGRRVVHHFGVAVIGGDQHFAAARLSRVDHAADAHVERFDARFRGSEVAGVADHVAVRVIADDGVVLAR